MRHSNPCHAKPSPSISIHMQMELLAKFPALNDKNISLFMKKSCAKLNYVLLSKQLHEHILSISLVILYALKHIHRSVLNR